MQRIISVEMFGALDVELSTEDYFNFLKEIKADAENKIKALPEFQQKRIGVEVTFSLGAKKKDGSVQGKVRIIEKEIRIDIWNITQGIHNFELIRQKLVNTAFDAVQRELPSIEASPELLREPAKVTEKKKWWRFW